ncbi:uncharacterized protein LOC128884015 [Hylaeus volcanicus]|uniref:uncharacterized protein LOC128884015 n=1 Tax=Hylaeus volcanicus TaxID=313075 RepID=UPI0023B7E6E8|nr:uncharacterized protein LOC128884015 [Hylaeus volcanicus]XP_053992950.1 uncharacterized protein LOC128884015 [Hylaeus volcanicus]XP_053992952.1 uncharacterized protein LOC128884015 [Hylaeus volcanicus]XP_053992953.1 uncharacterized protein LOC128884015 [Hylaeus volcanicus]
MELKNQSFQNTIQPIVTGQSVLAVCYKDGVMMIADTQLSYGNQRKFQDVPRLFSVCRSKVLIGFSGEHSDAQYIMKMMEQIDTDNFVNPTVPSLNALQLSGYLSRIFYNHRNKFNPLWNQTLVAGINDNTPYLSYVDYHGTTFNDTVMATGFGAYFALPLLREKAKSDMTESEAKDLLEECMKILSVRDCRGHNKVLLATVNKDGVTMHDMYTIKQNWEHKAFLTPSIANDLCGSSW